MALDDAIDISGTLASATRGTIAMDSGLVLGPMMATTPSSSISLFISVTAVSALPCVS